MWLFIPQALANSARPLIIGLKERDESLYIRRLKQLIGVLFWLGAAFAVVVTLLSHFLIDVLYGADYAQARGPLLLMIWSMVFSSLSNARAIWMICENKQKFTKLILLCGVIVNLILNSIGIPLFGMNGAAAATLVTEFVCCLVAPLLFKETREYVGYMLQSFNVIELVKGARQ